MAPPYGTTVLPRSLPYTVLVLTCGFRGGCDAGCNVGGTG